MIHDSNAIPANNRNKRARLQEDGGFIAPFIPQNIPTTAIPLARTPLIHPSTAAAPLAPNNNVEWPEEDDGEQVHIPNDTEAAIQLLIAQFPAAIKTPPFALKTQLYSVLQDRTLADRQLDELRLSNKLRVFKLATGSDDYALMPISNYKAVVQTAYAALVEENPVANKSGTNNSSAIKASKVVVANGSSSKPSLSDTIVERFLDIVLPACHDVSITHTYLLRLLMPPVQSRNSADVDSSNRDLIQQQPQTMSSPQKRKLQARNQAAISLLLRIGCIVRGVDAATSPCGGTGHHESSEEKYMFAIPNAGPAVLAVTNGRKELLSVLKRRRHPEMLQAELEKKGMRQSALGPTFHLRDLLGSGVLTKIDTTVGPLIRIAAR